MQQQRASNGAKRSSSGRLRGGSVNVRLIGLLLISLALTRSPMIHSHTLSDLSWLALTSELERFDRVRRATESCVRS